ncbi:MAG: amidohydrolase family protein, partial [Myxococcota bacterium]|nr:amidohydrolase family protein [Myxococcota bacterium]
EAGALAALTINPARMMELDDRIGSIEVGKDADLVVLSGPPLSTWTHVEQTWIEGQMVFDRARPSDRAIAVGGDAAPPSHPSETP